MKNTPNLTRTAKSNKHADAIKGARKHAGSKAPAGASGEAGGVFAGKRKMQLPKRRELHKPNVWAT